MGIHWDDAFILLVLRFLFYESFHLGDSMRTKIYITTTGIAYYFIDNEVLFNPSHISGLHISTYRSEKDFLDTYGDMATLVHDSHPDDAELFISFSDSLEAIFFRARVIRDDGLSFFKLYSMLGNSSEFYSHPISFTPCWNCDGSDSLEEAIKKMNDYDFGWNRETISLGRVNFETWSN